MADGDAANKPKKSDDPIGDLISNKTKPASDHSAMTAANSAKSRHKNRSQSTEHGHQDGETRDHTRAANKKDNFTIQAGSFCGRAKCTKIEKQLATKDNWRPLPKTNQRQHDLPCAYGQYASAKDAQAANQKSKAWCWTRHLNHAMDSVI